MKWLKYHVTILSIMQVFAHIFFTNFLQIFLMCVIWICSCFSVTSWVASEREKHGQKELSLFGKLGWNRSSILEPQENIFFHGDFLCLLSNISKKKSKLSKLEMLVSKKRKPGRLLGRGKLGLSWRRISWWSWSFGHLGMMHHFSMRLCRPLDIAYLHSHLLG